MQSCFQDALDFFLLSFGFRVERLQVGGEVFFFKCMWCGEWTIQSGHWTFHASFIGGGRGGGVGAGAGGEDLFSFQPIGGPKLGGDREDFFFSFPCFLMFLIMFLKFTMCSSTCSPYISTSLLAHMLWHFSSI
jgi:hypothetical protein